MSRRRFLVAIVALAVVVAVGAAVAVTHDGGPAADAPGTETVVVEAPRGRILDRSGKILVEDGTLLEVRVDADEVAALDAEVRAALLADLAELLATDRETSRPASAGVAVGAPITADTVGERIGGAGEGDSVVATGVGDQVRDSVEGEPDRFPGVTVTPVGGRTYRYGALAAHVLGYVGQADADAEQRLGVDEGSTIGVSGAEQAFDEDLRGTPGRIVYEIDAEGQRVRELVDRRVEPERGRDVYLTVDINLQYLVEKGLAAEVERRRGVQDNGCFLSGGCDPQGAAAVAVDPRDGGVLAMASYPTYDPMLFAGGISDADHQAISAEDAGDEHGFPLLDRATAGQYAPAATLKPFVAHAGLAEGLLTPDFVYDDTGVYAFSASCDTTVENNCSARNAGGVGTGAIDLADALARSSDTYFYKLGDDAWRGRDRLGETALQDGIEAWGFGEPTGIDLPSEASGRVPTPDWLMDFSININGDTEEAREAGTWTSGTSGNLAVGQGDVLASPLQMATAYAALANGGTRWRPQLLLRSTAYASDDGGRVAEPDAVGEVDLPDEWLDPIVAGLDDATKAPSGTATSLFAGFDQSRCAVMAKTGTAQVNDRNDTSLVAAVAPTPTAGAESVIAFSAVVQEAGFGAAVAGPVARRVFEPLASMGCDLDAFGGSDSPYEAPLGGWFDVAEAQAEFIPPSASEGVTSG